MIDLYTGTPGSGKSLHVAERIKTWVEIYKHPVICNFTINQELLRPKGNGQIITIKNKDLDEKNLYKFTEEYKKKIGKKKLKEDTILLVIDEAQIIFNSRNWNDKDRLSWISFFSQHRKLGYKIILIAQYDEMIDKQIRALVEYTIVHRKLKNINAFGGFVNMLLGGGMHIWIKVYNGLNEKCDSGYYKGNRILYSMYDTYDLFE